MFRAIKKLFAVDRPEPTPTHAVAPMENKYGRLSDIPVEWVDVEPEWLRELFNEHKSAFVSVALGLFGHDERRVGLAVNAMQCALEMELMRSGNMGVATEAALRAGRAIQ